MALFAIGFCFGYLAEFLSVFLPSGKGSSRRLVQPPDPLGHRCLTLPSGKDFSMWASLFPAMELATGILFPVIIRSYGFNVFGVTNLVIGFLFIVIAGSDSLCRLIPNKALALIAALSLLLSAIRGITQGPHVLIWALLGGAVGFLLLYPVALFRPGELGIGDIKTAGAMGLYLGAGKILPALALSFILAALWVLPLLVLGYKRKNDQIPLGVFLAAGALLVAVSA